MLHLLLSGSMYVLGHSFNAQSVSFLFCLRLYLHRDSRLARREGLGISHIFPGHAYSFVHEIQPLDPGSMFELFKTSYGYPIFLPFKFLTRLLFVCNIKQSPLIYFMYVCMYVKCPRDRAFSPLSILSH